jgi:GNAT superfamily N-acetyltransferase
MSPESEYFVGTCSHVDDISEPSRRAEADVSAEQRIALMRRLYEGGLRVTVAFADEKPVGFIHVMPIEISSWGPLGADLYTIPCLFVVPDAQHHGAGHMLMEAAEREARQAGAKGLTTVGYTGDFWFMPAGFFQGCGFQIAEQRKSTTLLWKAWDETVEPPRLLQPQYEYQPAAGKVVVDLFWNAFCPTSAIEAQRVRDVAAEFGDAVILNEYGADQPDILRQTQIPRAIFVNGVEIGWGYEAPREGIQSAIQDALQKE